MGIELTARRTPRYPDHRPRRYGHRHRWGVAVRHALRQLRAAAAIIAAPGAGCDRGSARAPGGRRL